MGSEDTTKMGRAIMYLVPRNVIALAALEVVLSFMVVHLVLAGNVGGLLLPDQINGLAGQSNNLAAVLALTTVGVTLAMNTQGGAFRLTPRRLLAAACVAGIVAMPVVLLMFKPGLLWLNNPVSVAWLAAVLGIWLAVILAFRVAFTTILRHAQPQVRRVLFVGNPQRVDIVSRRIQSARAGRFEYVTCDPSQVSWEAIRQQNIWTVVVSPATGLAHAQSLLDCKLRGIPVISDLGFQERHLGRIDLDALGAGDILFSEGYQDRWLTPVMKRVCDIVFSLVMLFLTLPLMTLTAIAIKADTPGPVFYRQTRIGKFGQPFTLFKFRSMTTDAEAGGAVWAQKKDPRVTRVGAFIRTTRIDELPQLANVILGQMSLVGPRPERPHFVSQLAAAIPFYHERSYVKPGVTGWAQVNYPYGASVEDAREKLAYDLYYVKHRGILLDLLILLSTVRVVLFREGAR